MSSEFEQLRAFFYYNFKHFTAIEFGVRVLVEVFLVVLCAWLVCKILFWFIPKASFVLKGFFGHLFYKYVLPTYIRVIEMLAYKRRSEKWQNKADGLKIVVRNYQEKKTVPKPRAKKKIAWIFISAYVLLTAYILCMHYYLYDIKDNYSTFFALENIMLENEAFLTNTLLRTDEQRIACFLHDKDCSYEIIDNTSIPAGPTEMLATHEKPRMIDIGDNHWAVVYINELVLREIISGYRKHDGTYEFRPNNEILRAELMKLVSDTLKLETVPEFDGSAFVDWNDVPEWAKPYVAAVVEADIILGSIQEEGVYIFANDCITREEMVVMVVRAIRTYMENNPSSGRFGRTLGDDNNRTSDITPNSLPDSSPDNLPDSSPDSSPDSTPYSSPNSSPDSTYGISIDSMTSIMQTVLDFEDVSIWAKDSVAFALANDMIKTDMRGFVKPNNNARRDEVAMMLYKLLEYLELL